MKEIENENEILFWKVYRNVYLKKLIFHQLNQVEIKFSDHSSFNSKGRIQFKDIKSLLWMIQKKQFKLLEYKLLNNEEITIARSGILKLIKLFKKDENGNLSITHNDYYISRDSIPPPETISISKGFEILKLLFEKHREQFDKYRLVEDCINYKRIEFLKFIISPPISFKITNYCFETAMNKRSLETIECLLKYYDFNNHTASRYYKRTFEILNRSMQYLIEGQKQYLNKNIEFILNNPIFFPIPLYESSLKVQPHLQGLFNQLNQIVYVESIELQNRILDLGYFKNTYNKNQFYQCILNFNNHYLNEPFNSLFSINKILLLFRLFYLCNNNTSTTVSSTTVSSTTITHSKFYLNNIPDDIKIEILNLISKNEENEIIIEKLFKLLVLKSKSKKLYSLYYFKYYKLIEYDQDGIKLFKNDTLIRINLQNSIEILNQLELNGDKDKIIEFICNLFIDNKNNRFNSLNNFKKWGKYRILINKIRNIIFSSMDSNEWYQKAINLIEKSSSTEIRNKFDFPLIWNENLKLIMVEPFKSNEILYINDKEVIDWLFKHKLRNSYPNKHSFINCIASEYLYKKNILGMVKFKNNQLLHYSIYKLELNFKNNCKNIANLYNQNKLNNLQLFWYQIYDNPLNPDFFKQYNIDINSSVLGNNSGDQSCEVLKLMKELTFDGINGYKFAPVLLQYLKQHINYNQFISTNTFNYYWLDNNINYQKIMFETLIISIINFDLFKTKLILDGIKNFNDLSNSFLKIWIDKSTNEHKFIFKNLMSNYNNVSYLEGTNFETVSNYIKFWLNYINKEDEKQQDQQSSLMIIIFNKIINFLYKKLIKIKGITTYQVYEIRNLIFKSTTIIKLDHSLYHSFFYLNIKSPKFIKLIFLFKGIYIYDNNYDDYDDDHAQITSTTTTTTTTTPKTNLFKSIINSNLFTFDYVIGDTYFENCGCYSNSKSTYESILENLINYFKCHYLGNGEKQLLSKEQQESISYGNFSHIFSYFIDINRLDLFFRELESFKKFTELNKNSKQIENFRYYFKYNADISIFKNHLNHDGAGGSLFIKFIELVQFICDDPNYHFRILSNSITNHNFEYITFLINHYQINEITKELISFRFIYMNPIVFEYICINHSNLKFKNNTELICSLDYLPMIELTKKYHPYIFKEWQKSKEIIKCINDSIKNNNLILLDKFYEIGLIDKDLSNNNYKII